jgi:hypothetical protein
MCVSGAIEQKDLSGLVTHASSQKNIIPELHHGGEQALHRASRHCAELINIVRFIYS